MKRIEFGIGKRKVYTGADLYVRIFQLVSILPLIYIFTATGYTALFRRSGAAAKIISWLFDIGLSSLPRAEAWLLSWVYRLTSSEVIVYFALLITALALGMCTGALFGTTYNDDYDKSDRRARKNRIVFSALIAADLVMRLIPVHYNLVFGIAPAVIGFILRAACLCFLIMDIRSN